MNRARVPSPQRHLVRWLALAAVCALNGCTAAPAVPDHPSWSDVEPILRAECSGCHGGSAPVTGSARGVIYRLDFYDVGRDVCGDATEALVGARFAAAASPQIASDITSLDGAVRPRMPPLPAPYLADWEWQTLLRWARDPVRGLAPAGNHLPAIRITSPTRVVKRRFTLSAVLEDPEGEAAIGVLTIGDVTLRMDRPGSFSIAIDASQWGLGRVAVQAVVCDGWGHAAYDLGYFVISG
jgi:hypothetical protein